MRQYWLSVEGLVSSIVATTWDQTWQAASVRERSALSRIIFAGYVVGLVAVAGLGDVFPAAVWLFYYAVWGSLYAWLGRSRSVADAPGRDSGVRLAVSYAKELGLDIPRFANWVRDVFRTLPAADGANVGRVTRWLYGPVGVVGLTVLVLAFAVVSPQERPDPAGVLVLRMFPVAFGLAASQRVHLHRQSRRDAFVERVDREISVRLTGNGAPGQTIPPSAPAPAAPSDAANALRTQIVVGVVVALAIGLFFYMLPPLYH